MIRYFKKELPDRPLFLPNGKSLPFRMTPAGVGIIAVRHPPLLGELDKVLVRNIGGLVEIGESEFLKLRDGGQPERKRNKPRRAEQKAADAETPTAEQLFLKWKYSKKRMVFKPVTSGLRTVGRLFHVVERHRQAEADSERRVLAAFWSWVYHYERGVVPCHVWDYPRSAKAIGDTRDLPYLKDVLAAGLARAAADDDIIVLTNDDTVLHRKIVSAITRMLKNVDALSSFRMNFERDDMPSTGASTAKIRQWGQACVGRDLFAFRVKWLRLNWNAIPDFLLGEQDWDLVLALMVRMAADVPTTQLNMDVNQPRCELERGYVIHEIHERRWMDDSLAKAAAKIYNNRLQIEWKADNGFETLIGKIVL